MPDLRLRARFAAVATAVAGCAAGSAAVAVNASPPAASAPSATAACQARSGAQAVPLVELYTSQGCSSCPPAERWLSTYSGAGIPLALHVGYWDHIGWKDPWAKPAFNERQRQLALRNTRAGERVVVYTPEVFVAGGEATDWRDPRAFARRVSAVEAAPARARIAVRARLEAAGTSPATRRLVSQVDWSADAGVRSPQLHVAVKRSGYATAVRAGENRGATLREDHVARAWTGPLAPAPGATAVTLDLPEDARDGLTLVAFVHDADSGQVLQALALPLDGCDDPRR